MTWENSGLLTVNGTDQLLNQLAGWLSAGRSWNGNPGTITCPTVVDVSGTDPITLCSTSVPNRVYGYTTHPRWANTAGVMSAARQKLWRFEKNDGVNDPVDFWFLLDIAESGGTIDSPNMGLFCLLTSDVGKTAAQFKDLYYSGHPTTAIPGNPTAPRMSSVWPSYGADTCYFFSDGYTVHVAFRRTTVHLSSWQHFSFGTINKASGAWEGGEYFSGNCAGSPNNLGWNSQTEPMHTAYYSRVMLSGSSNMERFSEAANEPDCHSKGIIRVVGAEDAYAPSALTVSYCALGDSLTLSSLTQSEVTSKDRDRVGSVGVLGGLSAYQQVPGGVSLSAGARPTLNMQELCPNTWDLRAPGSGVDLFYFDFLVSKRWQYLGSVQGVRFLNAASIPELSIVNSDWVVIPLSTDLPENKVAGGQGNTCYGSLAVAYRIQGG